MVSYNWNSLGTILPRGYSVHNYPGKAKWYWQCGQDIAGPFECMEDAIIGAREDHRKQANKIPSKGRRYAVR